MSTAKLTVVWKHIKSNNNNHNIKTSYGRWDVPEVRRDIRSIFLCTQSPSVWTVRKNKWSCGRRGREKREKIQQKLRTSVLHDEVTVTFAPTWIMFRLQFLLEPCVLGRQSTMFLFILSLVPNEPGTCTGPRTGGCEPLKDITHTHNLDFLKHWFIPFLKPNRFNGFPLTRGQTLQPRRFSTTWTIHTR